LDFSLVANKNLSKIIPSSSLVLQPDEVRQKGLKLFHLCHSQKKRNPKPKSFFRCRHEDLPSLKKVCTAL